MDVGYLSLHMGGRKKGEVEEAGMKAGIGGKGVTSREHITL